MEILVHRVDDVQKHPTADNLTVVSIAGNTCIANIKEDGTWRYNPGDLAVYVPVDTILPEATLKRIGYWNEEKGKGYLAGSKGNRVKARTMQGVESTGILIPIDNLGTIPTEDGSKPSALTLGMDVSNILL